MAIAVLGVLPVVLVYPFIQNNFIKGITLGGVKGLSVAIIPEWYISKSVISACQQRVA